MGPKDGPEGWARRMRMETIGEHPGRELPDLERLGRSTTPPMEALLASLQDGFEILDPSGTIVDVNERFAEIVGRPREELIGLQTPFPWWSERDAPRIREAMTSVLAGGSGEFD